jgi:hypothetical protein
MMENVPEEIPAFPLYKHSNPPQAHFISPSGMSILCPISLPSRLGRGMYEAVIIRLTKHYPTSHSNVANWTRQGSSRDTPH